MTSWGDVIKRIAKTNGNKLSHKQCLGLLANWHCQTMMFWDSFIFSVPNCQEGQLASVKGIIPDLLYFFLQTKFVKWSDMILSWWCVVSSLHLPQNTQTISRYRTARLLNALVCFIIFLFLMIVSCLRHFIDGMVLAMSVVTIAYSAKWSCWWNK